MIEGWQNDWHEKDETRRKFDRDILVGWGMVAFLVIGTIVEYIIAISLDANLPIMIAINIAEAVAIMVYFMHVSRVWRPGEHGQHGEDE